MARQRLAPGCWTEDGVLHIDLGEMLVGAGYDDTPANRATLERAAVELAARLGIDLASE